MDARARIDGRALRPARVEALVRELLVEVPENVADEPEAWYAVDDLVPDALTAAAAAERERVARSEAALLLSRIAGLPFALGRYGDAVTLGEWALRLIEAEPEPDARVVPEVKAQLASALVDHGGKRRAQRLAEDALDASLGLHGEWHQDTAQAMATLAFVHYKRLRVFRAVRLLRRAVAIARHTMGDDHIVTQIMFGNLAAIYGSAGLFRRARRMTEETLEVRRYVHGPEHPRTLSAMHNLGRMLRGSAFGNARGHELLELVAWIRTRTLGPDHPATRLVLVDALPAWMYDERRRLRVEALEADHLDLTDAQHPRTRATLRHLARRVAREGDREEARRLLESALAADRRAYGPGHWLARRTARQLLALLVKRGDGRGALRAAKAAVGL